MLATGVMIHGSAAATAIGCATRATDTRVRYGGPRSPGHDKGVPSQARLHHPSARQRELEEPPDEPPDEPPRDPPLDPLLDPLPDELPPDEPPDEPCMPPELPDVPELPDLLEPLEPLEPLDPLDPLEPLEPLMPLSLPPSPLERLLADRPVFLLSSESWSPMPLSDRSDDDLSDELRLLDTFSLGEVL